MLTISNQVMPQSTQSKRLQLHTPHMSEAVALIADLAAIAVFVSLYSFKNSKFITF